MAKASQAMPWDQEVGNEAVLHATSCLFNLPLTGYDNIAGAGSH